MTKTTTKAVALRYHPKEDKAPRVVASGKGELAKKIIRLAREHQLPLIENKLLVDLLLQLPVGDPIPPVVYQVVAEIYAFLITLEEGKQ
ncbi:MAG: flagellar biosynthesis protein FlhB [Calditrichaeota bacterium]|nr:MAG: flagellar biosynthesis protein FlhB [Calditrichota bacterium]